MELARLFKPLMELEYQMHRMYMWFSDMFQEDPKAFSLFRLMAREELQHRESVQNQFYMVVDRSNEYQEIQADIDGMTYLTNILKKQVDRRNSMTLQEALTTALQFEKSAAESHYRYIIARSNPILKEMIQELAKADQQHVQRLEQFAKSSFKA